MLDKHALSKKVFQDPQYFIAFGFGTGLMPFAPGTWGTLAGVLMYLLFSTQSVFMYVILTLIAFVIGVFVSEKVCKDLGEQDYSGIVWDEVVGFLVSMFAVPVHALWMVLGFLLFRLFDIWKPGPIRYLDNHLHGGLGVMLDDILAGVMACIVLHLIVWSVS